MGIRSKIKKRLPIFGRKTAPSSNPNNSVTPSPSPPSYQPPSIQEPESARQGKDVQAFIKELIDTNDVVLFMKGTPQQPLCGFSANAAGILASYKPDFAHFDVISDPDVRQGIKDFSMWPTLPQIYIKQEFIGGSDILSQMHEKGELKALIGS